MGMTAMKVIHVLTYTGEGTTHAEQVSEELSNLKPEQIVSISHGVGVTADLYDHFSTLIVYRD